MKDKESHPKILSSENIKIFFINKGNVRLFNHTEAEISHHQQSCAIRDVNGSQSVEENDTI